MNKTAGRNMNVKGTTSEGDARIEMRTMLVETGRKGFLLYCGRKFS